MRFISDNNNRIELNDDDDEEDQLKAQNCDIDTLTDVLNKSEVVSLKVDNEYKSEFLYGTATTRTATTIDESSSPTTPLYRTNLVDSNYVDNNNKNDDGNLRVYQNVSYVNGENVEECMQIDTENLITITEDQLVKIEYQNTNGIINTEYIVNEEIFNIDNNNYVNIVNIYNEDEETNNGHREHKITDTKLCTVGEETLITHHQSVLSPTQSEDEVSETDLTSLNWLHNITNIMAVPNLPTPPVSPKPRKKPTNSNQEDLTININFYKKNGDKKPPFSYATLICMAMGKNGNKMTLSAIYHWIRENFLYYRKAHPSWQVSKRF